MRRLLIFLKYPTPGEVKTRLAATLGNESAAEIYRACTEMTLERLNGFRQDAWLYVDPPAALERTRGWVGEGWLLRPQHGATLGERLAKATGDAFASGAQHVVAIGTDSPWLTVQDMQDAYAALEQHDLGLGPAEDGGYYLIGLARPVPELFDRINWGTSSVYAETVAKAHTLGLRLRCLRLGYDIDRLEDLHRFLTEANNGDVSIFPSELLQKIETSPFFNRGNLSLKSAKSFLKGG